MTIVRFNAETAAASDWRAVSLPIATLIVSCDYLAQNTALPDAVVLLLGEIARDAASALALQRSLLRSGYTPAIDDGLATLQGRMARSVDKLAGRIHQDYVALMVQACGDLALAVRTRRAGRAGVQPEPEESAARQWGRTG